ncbi:class I SAM-dependent methyltransferase [Streptomyces sp. NPDC058579]|uniref:class I SAM-dependent methyltransferase n=1 Tax=Streptomyces sp. NPDC058579 TaxID=3346548 RepID=UPI003661005E
MADLSYLVAVRESYDTVAAAYADIVPPPARLDPVSRGMLEAFAEVVGNARLGAVADVGCGPGKVTAYLDERGVGDVLGVDLSAAMVGQARRAYPRLPFVVGSMTALPVADGTLGGVLAYYSTHHTPPEELPTVFGEFHRALAPGGQLMLAGHVGDRDGDGERLRPTEAYCGLPVSYTSYLLPPERIAELLRRAGFVLTARLTQEPGEGARRRSGTFFARKPDGS